MASLTYEQRQSNAKAIALELCGQSDNDRYRGKIYGAVDEFLSKMAESASPQSVAQLKAVDKIVKADVLPRLAKAGVIEYLPSKKEDVICKIIGNSAVLSYLCIANTSDLDTETLAPLYSIFQKAPATATSINYKDFAEIVDPNTPFQWSLSSDAIDNEMISRIKKAKSISLKTITGDEEEQPAAPAETAAPTEPTTEPVAPATEIKKEEPVEQPIEPTKAEETVAVEPPAPEEPPVEPPTEAPVETPAEAAPTEAPTEEPTEAPTEEPIEAPSEATAVEEPTVQEPIPEESPAEETPASVEETKAIDDELGDPDNITDSSPVEEVPAEPTADEPVEEPAAPAAPVETPTSVEPETPAEPPVETPVHTPIPENLKHNEEEEVKPEPKKPRQPIRFQLPEGFGKPTSAAIWNTPVITDFGYPFLNFSSEAIQHLFKTKDLDDKKRTFKNIKKMLNVAKKRYGGIWKAIYGAPLELFKKFASDPGTICVPNYLKVDADILDENSDTVSVAPIKYFSVDTDYQPNVEVPRAFLENFYDVLDFTKAFKTYVKYADGLTMQEFYEEICDNDGKCPFYLLVPKQAKFSRTDVSTGSLFSALFGGTRCIMLKTIFKGKSGCFLIDKKSAKNLYSDIN
jgi:hypothetical protein